MRSQGLARKVELLVSLGVVVAAEGEEEGSCPWDLVSNRPELLIEDQGKNLSFVVELLLVET